MLSPKLLEWSMTVWAESTCKKRIEWSTQQIILASAYVLYYFLSNTLIYQVEWYEVENNTNRLSWVWPDWSSEEFVPRDQSDMDWYKYRECREIWQKTIIIQMQIIAMVHVSKSTNDVIQMWKSVKIEVLR